jgi:hypothetical protein
MADNPDFFLLIRGLDEPPDQQGKGLLQEEHDDSVYFKITSVNKEEYSCSSDGTGGLLRLRQRRLSSLAIAEDASSAAAVGDNVAVGIPDVAAAGIPDDLAAGVSVG